MKVFFSVMSLEGLGMEWKVINPLEIKERLLIQVEKLVLMEWFQPFKIPAPH